MSAIAVAEPERVIFRHGKNRDFTEEEIDEIRERAMAAYTRGDKEEFRRIYRQIPLNPDVVDAFASVYGKDWILECNFDLTEADLKFGKGWLNAYAQK